MMKKNKGPCMGRMLLILLMICHTLTSRPESLSSLYSSLDPTSIAQHFAFYELYPKTPEGKEALKHVWTLLRQNHAETDSEWILPTLDIQPILSIVNRSDELKLPELENEQLFVIDKLGKRLHNRQLKGFGLWELDAILKLDPEEIDLARGLLIAELGNSPDIKKTIQSYEASLDLMALQVLARLPPNPSPKDMIRAMNDYVFSEMRFRFPPHSLYAKDIDVYTFLPSVLDNRKGVCLGVSILYLSLAQRLNLTLQAVTPPGHIYVRYPHPDQTFTNIETTARGIDIPSESYLGIDTRKLQQRTLKEVIGLAFMNQAAASWHAGNHQETVRLYEKAHLFLPEDPLLHLFLGLNYLFVHKEKEGIHLLKKTRQQQSEYAVIGDTIAEDYLAGHADAEALKIVFQEVDETKESILKKQAALETVVKKHPQFRQGWFHLAVTWLQLGREKEALPLLQRYTEIFPEDPTVNYYLATIYFQRYHFSQAWHHFRKAEKIVQAKQHNPKALTDLKRALQRTCPEPLQSKV